MISAGQARWRLNEKDSPNHRCASAAITYGSELSVAVRHLGRDVGHGVPMLGNLAVADMEEIEERRGLTAERPLRRGEHEVTFRDGLHLLLMIARYLLGRYLEAFVSV